MKNLRRLTRKDLGSINGGDQSYAFCDQNGICPPPPSSFANYYCSNGICYRSSNGGGSGGGCNEPQRLCESWETGCGCVY